MVCVEIVSQFEMRRKGAEHSVFLLIFFFFGGGGFSFNIIVLLLLVKPFKVRVVCF